MKMQFYIFLIFSLISGCSQKPVDTTKVSKEIKTLSNNEVLDFDLGLRSKLLKIKEFNNESNSKFSKSQFLQLSSNYLAKELSQSYAKGNIKFYSDIDKINFAAIVEIASLYRMNISINKSRLLTCFLEIDSYDSTRPLNNLVIKQDIYKCINDAFLISKMTLSDDSPSESFKKISSPGEYKKVLPFARFSMKTTISELIKKHKEFI